jgi:hypothetical protein
VYYRSKETSRSDFIFYSDRLIRLLVEEGYFLFGYYIKHFYNFLKGLNLLPYEDKVVETPTGFFFKFKIIIINSFFLNITFFVVFFRSIV